MAGQNSSWRAPSAHHHPGLRTVRLGAGQDWPEYRIRRLRKSEVRVLPGCGKGRRRSSLPGTIRKHNHPGRHRRLDVRATVSPWPERPVVDDDLGDRKSTRLNSSHLGISYAVFCLEKKKIKRTTPRS